MREDVSGFDGERQAPFELLNFADDTMQLLHITVGKGSSPKVL